MPYSDRAAVGIYPIPIEWAEIRFNSGFSTHPFLIGKGCHIREHLRCKRLMDFPKVDVGESKLVTCQQARDSIGGRHQQPLGMMINSRYFIIDEPGIRNASG